MTDEANEDHAQDAQQKPLEELDCYNSITRNTLHLLPVLLGLDEVTREAYLEQYGRQNLLGDPVTAASTRIGKAVVNLPVLHTGILKAGCYLSIEAFDNMSYIVHLTRITNYANSLSARGDVKNLNLSFFILSITDQQVSAILRLAELNTIYLLKYNSSSAEHYLFKTPIDLIKVPEEVDMPVRRD